MSASVDRTSQTQSSIALKLRSRGFKPFQDEGAAIACIRQYISEQYEENTDSTQTLWVGLDLGDSGRDGGESGAVAAVVWAGQDGLRG